MTKQTILANNIDRVNEKSIQFGTARSKYWQNSAELEFKLVGG